MTLPARRLVAALLLISVASGTPAAAQGAACKPVPVASTRSLPPYPAASLKARETGVVLLKVTVARDGHPSRASVARSSGFARLDEAAANHVRRHYLWKPTACGPAQTDVRVVFERHYPE